MNAGHPAGDLPQRRGWAENPTFCPANLRPAKNFAPWSRWRLASHESRSFSVTRKRCCFLRKEIDIKVAIYFFCGRRRNKSRLRKVVKLFALLLWTQMRIIIQATAKPVELADLASGHHRFYARSRLGRLSQCYFLDVSVWWHELCSPFGVRAIKRALNKFFEFFLISLRQRVERF